MRHILWAVGAAAALGLSGSRAIGQESPKPALGGWGAAVDPDGDCRIGADGGKLTIEVPGKKHDLSIETGEMNAPRVLKGIDGDFIAQAKVAGNIRHSGKRTSDRSLAYHGAGLLLWQDARTYVRLERAAIVREDGQVVHYTNFELRRDGEAVLSNAVEIPDQDTYLRMERRGDRVYGLVSADGFRWACFEPMAATLPWDVKLGFAAVSTSSDPLKVSFSEWEVYKAQAQVKPVNP
jgi:regulation of enolase protein 1 (concanavalin A-like superfamily)